MENYNTLRNGILHEMMANLGRKSHEKVAAEIYGKIYYLTERQVRALCLVAIDKMGEGDDVFTEFCDNVVVYSGRHKRTSKKTMRWSRAGGFEDDFDEGFMDANGRLRLQLLRYKRQHNG